MEPIDIFTAARDGTTTTLRQSTTRTNTTPSPTTAAVAIPTDKSQHQAEMDDKSAWALSRRWFYVNRLGRFRGQGGRRIINM